MRLILASASPRRAELLQAAGFAIEIVPVDVDESVRSGEQPPDYVLRLASEKAALAQQVASADPGAIILGADTAVVVEGEILGKPGDADEAAAMLQRLAGRVHDVLTGVSVRLGDTELTAVESTRVHFAPVSPDDLAWYVASGEGLDKAGAYAIQGLASRFIIRIEGSYSNVVGLPVAVVYALVRQLDHS